MMRGIRHFAEDIRHNARDIRHIAKLIGSWAQFKCQLVLALLVSFGVPRARRIAPAILTAGRGKRDKPSSAWREAGRVSAT